MPVPCPFHACVSRCGVLLSSLHMLADRIGAPVLDLAIRLTMANIFFQSGWLKFKNALNHDWGSTVFLFQDVHPLPGISAEIAAIAGTAGELGLSALLALGLCGRCGAAGLIVMTLAIQFVVPAQYGVASPDHYLWILLLGVILIRGPGLLSLDALIARWLRRIKQGCSTPSETGI